MFFFSNSLIFVSLLTCSSVSRYKDGQDHMGESIVMMRGSWTPSVPSPLSLWEPLETLSSGTETLGENRCGVRLNL